MYEYNLLFTVMKSTLIKFEEFVGKYVNEDDHQFRHGLVIDDACPSEWIQKVQEIRLSLPLNSKRPTVDRRFFRDDDRYITAMIEGIVANALESHGYRHGSFDIYCNKYLRILEYNRKGAELLPHTDGTKTCEDTSRKSSHTLLLFLSDCHIGGCTVIMDGKGDWSKQSNLIVREECLFSHDDANGQPGQQQLRSNRNVDHITLGVQPQCSRIFLFPHKWPHAGEMCDSIPKIALRAELTLVKIET